jgi:hypothetical protein
MEKKSIKEKAIRKTANGFRFKKQMHAENLFARSFRENVFGVARRPRQTRNKKQIFR